MASAGKTSIVEGTRGVHDYEPDTRRNYGGYGEWRSSLDWNKRREHASFSRRSFRPAAVKTGQPHLRFYDLRHTGASLFASSGMPLALVAEARCHSDTATTYKVHLGFFPDDFASDAERLDSWMDLSSPQQATPPIMFLHRSAG